jgi:hypothetical protein
MDISDKAKVIYATMEKLGAVDNENKITSYAILDYIIEESEELQEHELLKDIPEDDYMNITLEITLKGINTIITSLAKKDLVVKTEPTSITVDGTTRSLRQYYLKK